MVKITNEQIDIACNLLINHAFKRNLVPYLFTKTRLFHLDLITITELVLA